MESSNIIRGPIVISQITRKVLVDGMRDGEAIPVALVRKEFEILRLIALSSNSPVSRDDLERAVLGRSFTSASNAVDVHISRIRQKLKAARAGCEKLLVTVRHVGYMLRAPEESFDAYERA